MCVCLCLTSATFFLLHWPQLALFHPQPLRKSASWLQPNLTALKSQVQTAHTSEAGQEVARLLSSGQARSDGSQGIPGCPTDMRVLLEDHQNHVLLGKPKQWLKQVKSTRFCKSGTLRAPKPVLGHPGNNRHTMHFAARLDRSIGGCFWNAL